uniref:Uncharacterized protein n=1 Tax=Arundo donax TaxID=35708 RepID=A0A0A9BP51_ARUDO
MSLNLIPGQDICITVFHLAIDLELKLQISKVQRKYIDLS